MVCQDAGSIDAVPITDEKGARYLVWKEDGNSRKQPTPLWAQPLSDDGTKLIGEPREILRNEASWEAHLIEGPFIQKRDGWFYLFYSADACCGRRCNYKLGVARSRALLGPWERHPKNPILAANDDLEMPRPRQRRPPPRQSHVPALSRLRSDRLPVHRPSGPARRGDVGRRWLAGDQWREGTEPRCDAVRRVGRKRAARAGVAVLR